MNLNYKNESNKLGAEEFDKMLAILSESCVKPNWLIMHTDAWYGYFWKPKITHIRRVIFTSLGRFFRNKHIYWIGFPIRFVDGISKFYKLKPQEIIFEDEKE